MTFILGSFQKMSSGILPTLNYFTKIPSKFQFCKITGHGTLLCTKCFVICLLLIIHFVSHIFHSISTLWFSEVVPYCGVPPLFLNTQFYEMTQDLNLIVHINSITLGVVNFALHWPSISTNCFNEIKGIWI